jgi:hypothetical protein
MQKTAGMLEKVRQQQH